MASDEDLRHMAAQCTDRCLITTSKWLLEFLVALPTPPPPSKSQPLAPADLAEDDTYTLARLYFMDKEYCRCVHQLSSCQGPRASFLRDYAQYMEGEKTRVLKSTRTTDGEKVFQPEHFPNDQLNDLAAVLEPRCDTGASPTPDPFALYLYGVVLKALDQRPKAITILRSAIERCPWLWCAWLELVSLCESPEQLTALALPEGHPCHAFFRARVLLELHSDQALAAATRCQEMAPTAPASLLAVADAYYENGDYEQARGWYERLYTHHPYCLAGRDTYSNILFVSRDAPTLSMMSAQSAQLWPDQCETHFVLGLREYGGLSVVAAVNILGEWWWTALLVFLWLASRFPDLLRQVNGACVSCAPVVQRFVEWLGWALPGNYHSLENEHPKALAAFQKALNINPRCVSAWTLLGHEYLELRNTAAATQAYRRAIDINPRDYRAWFGLGQTHELLALHPDALAYYRHAAALRPDDPRMWAALGSCHEALINDREALLDYDRSLRCALGIPAGPLAEDDDIQTDPLTLWGRADRPPAEQEAAEALFASSTEAALACQRLARLHQRLGHPHKAALYHARVVSAMAAEPQSAPDAESLLYLGRYNLQEGLLEEAEACCARLLKWAGPEREEAEALLHQIAHSRPSEPRR
ncbi:putative anaphase-promoting complex subunit 8 [Paratrimastix pyriformis]|uniref:Anaphase-promoting complex subunit 8 n=1 Tax=Paratrimastix pyriformis TaxID=342808 RepID=A0ABQ8UUL7_9EUKA|nr:putative anaphase-promoting complex subunit 8 [Paratrimastix pyriformis]